MLQALCTLLLITPSVMFASHHPQVHNVQSNHNKGCVLNAVISNDVEVVKHILKNIISIDDQDHYGNTLLIIAACNGNNEAMMALLEHNANINATNHFGITPLLAAIMLRHLTTAQLLLQHGAQPLLQESLHSRLQHREYKEQQLFSEYATRPIPRSYPPTKKLVKSRLKHCVISWGDLIGLCAYTSMPFCINSKNVPTKKQRLTRYQEDMLNIMGKEDIRTQKLFTVLYEILPSVPEDILHTILTFETACYQPPRSHFSQNSSLTLCNPI